jgi:hypothetical protein
MLAGSGNLAPRGRKKRQEQAKDHRYDSRASMRSPEEQQAPDYAGPRDQHCNECTHEPPSCTLCEKRLVRRPRGSAPRLYAILRDAPVIMNGCRWAVHVAKAGTLKDVVLID